MSTEAQALEIGQTVRALIPFSGGRQLDPIAVPVGTLGTVTELRCDGTWMVVAWETGHTFGHPAQWDDTYHYARHFETV